MFIINKAVRAIYVHGSLYGTSHGNLRVFIPELMPNIPMGYPKITPISLNKSCYCNASDCKPAIASYLNTQNFVTAERAYNSYYGSLYKYGNEIAILPNTEDCLTCKLSPADCDNSYRPPEPEPEPEVKD